MSLYRNALILFDRVVMPVPTVPIGDLKQQEIDALAKDADKLTEAGAAVRVDWDPKQFHEMQKKTMDHEAVDSEALAKALVKDPPHATRLILLQKTAELASGLLPEGHAVTAVPVYGSQERYESVTKDLRHDVAEQATLEIIFKHFPVPAEDVSIDDILRLRCKPQYQDSLYHLRKWQTEIVGELLQHKDEKVLRAAERDLERWVKKYDQAMTDAKIKKVQTVVISVLAIGATLAVGAGPLIATLAALAPPLFSLQELRKPCWKQISDEQYAPAGVIYGASKL